MASSNGDISIVDALLRRGANVNYEDRVWLREQDEGSKARQLWGVIMFMV